MPDTFTEDQIAEMKTAVDGMVQKKLDQTESKIKEQSDQIAKLLETQDKLENGLKVAQREALVLRKSQRGQYTGQLSSEYHARGLGLIGLTLIGKAKPEHRKELETEWSNEYYLKPTRIGAFWDKYAAMFLLTVDLAVIP